MDFSKISLFYGVSPDEVASLLGCLGAMTKQYKKGSVIFAEGEITESLGIVLEGHVLLQHHDVWGTSSILGSAWSGDTFGESYACSFGQVLQISAIAAEETKVLFLNVNRVLTTCSHACVFHTTLIQNLLTVCAQKNLELSRRMMHTTPKTIRGRLLSYFSECVKKEKNDTFQLVYNRQQLADYLGVDRSAMCSELSKMQKDGLICYHRNQIQVCKMEEIYFV